VPEKSSYNYQELSDDLRKIKTLGENDAQITLDAQRSTLNAEPSIQNVGAKNFSCQMSTL